MNKKHCAPLFTIFILILSAGAYAESNWAQDGLDAYIRLSESDRSNDRINMELELQKQHMRLLQENEKREQDRFEIEIEQKRKEIELKKKQYYADIQKINDYRFNLFLKLYPEYAKDKSLMDLLSKTMLILLNEEKYFDSNSDTEVFTAILIDANNIVQKQRNLKR